MSLTLGRALSSVNRPRVRAALPMPPSPKVRPPFSMRHAFALAFDLALRRDSLHSLVIPLLLRAPWMVAFAVLVRREELDTSATSRMLAALALLGPAVTWRAV